MALGSRYVLGLVRFGSCFGREYPVFDVASAMQWGGSPGDFGFELQSQPADKERAAFCLARDGWLAFGSEREYSHGWLRRMGEMGLVLAWVCMVMLRYEHVVMSDLHGAGEQRLEWPRQSILYHDFQVVSWRAVIIPMCIPFCEYELNPAPSGPFVAVVLCSQLNLHRNSIPNWHSQVEQSDHQIY
jgi:hypothetical protein